MEPLQEMGRFTDSFLKTAERVKIYIGEKTDQSVPLVIPKYVLCRRISYFNRALSSKFEEGQTNVMHFPEDDQDAWVVLVYYLFTNEIEYMSVDDSHDDDLPYLSTLARAYVLGDKYGLTHFQNTIMWTVMQILGEKRTGMGCNEFLSLLELLPDDSHFRRFVLEELVIRDLSMWSGGGLEGLKAMNVSPDLLMDILTTTRKHLMGDIPTHQYGCNKSETERYYIVEEDEEQTA